MTNTPVTASKPPPNDPAERQSGARQSYTKTEMEFPGPTIIEAIENQLQQLDLAAFGLDTTEIDLLRLRSHGAGWRRAGRRVGLDHMTAKRKYIQAMQKLARQLTERML